MAELVDALTQAGQALQRADQRLKELMEEADKLDQRRQAQIQQQRDVIARLMRNRERARQILTDLLARGQISTNGHEDIWRALDGK